MLQCVFVVQAGILLIDVLVHGFSYHLLACDTVTVSSIRPQRRLLGFWSEMTDMGCAGGVNQYATTTRLL